MISVSLPINLRMCFIIQRKYFNKLIELLLVVRVVHRDMFVVVCVRE